MLTLYRPGRGWVHRAPAGPKALVLLLIVLVVSFLSSTYAAAIGTGAVAVLAYLMTGLGVGELVRQILAVRWVIVITFAAQLIFLETESAVANTTRVLSALLVAGLLVLTTRISDLLDAVERALRPLTRLGVNPARVALVLTVAMTTVPVLVRIGAGVREAQKARGVGGGLTSFVIPFLVMSLKHADDLGDALTARGVR